ncbi:HAD family hydrolase [Rubinisphaera margarita]|uniref:HAD family hydrolase n=1 Tax=Rubinisphaera margarita TaxID=2909586 RepID=UPI001EE85EDF|nr:HAD family phosphatase [Rubinisphaera margarita]MCG6158453.1 HAD family phosphatase [Rubinisphaera margarita]
MTVQALIFDIDGVLVDSYEAHFLSWKRLGERHDKVVTEEEFASQFGRTTREVLEKQWADRDLSDEDISRLDEEKEALYREIISGQFPEMPGARTLIERLKNEGWRIALGSSGPVENVQLAVEKLDLEPLIGAAISGDDVTKGKPDPEVFLKAAERIGVPPSRAIVVEDAAPGIAAAKAAGMASIGFISRGRTAEELAEADVQIRALSEISPALLTRLLER